MVIKFNEELNKITIEYKEKLSPHIIAYGRELAIRNCDPSIAKRYYEVILKNSKKNSRAFRSIRAF